MRSVTSQNQWRDIDAGRGLGQDAGIDIFEAFSTASLAVMKDIWGPIDPERWRETPATTGRCATEEDVKAGRAVFCVEGGSKPAEIKLPCAAIQHLENGTTQRVVVIQAERVHSGVALGVRPLEGGNSVCMEHAVEMLGEFP